MKILAIETSCDETAIAILDIEENEKGIFIRVLANEILSQIELHRPYGGVYPNLAKREHEKNLKPILEKALLAAESRSDSLVRQPSGLGLTRSSLSNSAATPIDCIAVTQGPGLEPCLWTGINFAKDLGKKWNVPVIPANHMEGHILAALLTSRGEQFPIPNFQFSIPEFPAIALLISGGHTELVLMSEIGKYQIVGQTRDDAVGECFDKTARLLGLAYPGGPEIGNLAAEARKENLKIEKELPRPMIDSPDLDFSFSGLKTSVLYATKNKTLSLQDIKKYALAIEESITDVLTKKVEKAIEEYRAKSLIVGGGVIANKFIRSALAKVAESFDIPFYAPHISHATDNALMIALAGYFKIEKKHEKDFGAEGNLRMDRKRL